MHFIQSILPALEHFHILAYWIAFFAALLETTVGIGLILPGSTLLLVMGALAARGFFDIGDLFWFAVVGAIIGDNLNYYIGKKFGEKIFAQGFWFIKPKHLKKGKDFFDRYGSSGIFFGRFIPSLKEIMPLIAGAFGMKKLPFMVWNILGAIGWSMAWILPGYFFSQSLNFAEIWLTRAGFFMATLFVVFILVFILKVFLVNKGEEFFTFLASVWSSIKEPLINNSDVQRFAKRHQTLFRFLHRRLDRNNFYGLPFTLFLVALIYLIFHFGGVVEGVINSDLVVSTDIRVANLLAIFRTPELTTFFTWITLFGKWQVVTLLTLTSILILWILKRRTTLIPLLVSILGSTFFTYIGKFIFHRPRPNVAVYPEDSFSFPSGHAAIAVAFYGFLTYLFIWNTRRWNKKINAFFVGFVLIGLIGLSRLYLGVHFLSDVWGGYLAGSIWLIIAISISEYFSYKKPIIGHQPIAKKRLIADIFVAAFGLYMVYALNFQMPALAQPPKPVQVKVSDAMTLFKMNSLKYTETLRGNEQAPISLLIVAKNDLQLMDLFNKAGWDLADEVSFSTLSKGLQASIFKQPYPTAPITPDFWYARVHDFGFEKSTDSNSIRIRHHARLWKTNTITEKGDEIYVGTASFDVGMKWVKWGVIHKIDPDIDAEREFLFNDLQKTDMIHSVEKIQFVDAVLGSNFAGDPFFTDGKLYLIFID